jgi:peptidoglycan/xylan/chitin deacetylase (PgdA/CDA1 family)
MITFMFHRISPEENGSYYFKRGTAISQRKFEEILRVIDSINLPVILPNQKANSTGVCLTFDDGYKDNLWAFRKLRDKHLESILFPVKDYIKNRFSITDDLASIYDQQEYGVDGLLKDRVRKIVRKMDNTRYRYYRSRIFGFNNDQCPADLFMSELELKEATSLGVSLGVHGTTHRIWPSLGDFELIQEVKESDKWLSQLSNNSIEYLAYPHGKEPNDNVFECLLDDYVNFGVDRFYKNPLILERIWVKENTDIKRVLNEYIAKRLA